MDQQTRTEGARHSLNPLTACLNGLTGSGRRQGHDHPPTPTIYSLSGIATLIETHGRVPTIDE
jgi:hypothetical protein